MTISSSAPTTPFPGRAALGALAALALGATVHAQETCATGAATMQTVVSGCFPTDCHASVDLDFGPTGNPTQLDVPKFDPSLGTLLEVRVQADFGFVGSYCADNQAPSCGMVEATRALLASAVPAGSNLPPITGLPPIDGQFVAHVTPPGFLLGPSDGVDDCQTPTGPPSDGSCTLGDHVIRTWDQVHSVPEVMVASTGLGAWIAGPQSTAVTFDLTVAAVITTSSSSPMSFGLVTRGRARIDVTYVYCPPLGTVYCDCTSSSPCGNPGQSGTGCANSTGLGARLAAGGTASLAAGDLVLSGSQLPPNRPGVFLSGAGTTPIGAAVVLGGGALCTTGQLTRLETVFADGSGNCTTSVDLGAGSGGVAGLPGYFQLWYRDAATAPCGGGSNLTNGLAIVWAP